MSSYCLLIYCLEKLTLTGINTSHYQISETQERRQLEIFSTSIFVSKMSDFWKRACNLANICSDFFKSEFSFKEDCKNKLLDLYFLYFRNMTRIFHVHGDCLRMYQIQRSEKTQFFLNYELRTTKTEGPSTREILL